MSVQVTMLQTRRGEDGNLWLAGQQYTATDAFARLLVSSNLATADFGEVEQSALSAAQVQAVRLLVSQGAGYEPVIGSAVTMRMTVDEGSDADHAEILLTFNAGPAGDVAIASERLANADARVDVVKTLLTGAAADGAVLGFSLPNGLQNLYVARAGEAAYTEAAGATITAAQAACARWDAGLQLRYCTVTIGGPYTGGGSNGRYRDIVVTAFVGN